MRIVSNPDRNNWETLTKRPTADFAAVEPIVDEVFAAVKGWPLQKLISV